MATPIPLNKSILDQIGLRLANITVANGYINTICKIKRAQLEPFKGYDLPAVNYWPTNLVNEVGQYNTDNRIINLVIEAHTKTMDEPFTDICDKLAADIITGLNRAPAAPKVVDPVSLDLGGIVGEFTNTGYDYQVGQGQAPFCGVVLTFSIKFTADTSVMIN